MEQNTVVVAVTQAQVESLWWILQYVVLPSIGAGYLFTLGVGKWLADRLSKNTDALYKKIDDMQANDIRHLEDRVTRLETHQGRR